MEDDDLPPDLLRLVVQDEKQILLHQDVTEAINLGTEEERKEVKIKTTLSPTTREKLIDLLRENSDVRSQHRYSGTSSAIERRMRIGQAKTKKGQARDASKDQGESEKAIRRRILGSIQVSPMAG